MKNPRINQDKFPQYFNDTANATIVKFDSPKSAGKRLHANVEYDHETEWPYDMWLTEFTAKQISRKTAIKILPTRKNEL